MPLRLRDEQTAISKEQRIEFATLVAESHWTPHLRFLPRGCQSTMKSSATCFWRIKLVSITCRVLALYGCESIWNSARSLITDQCIR